MTKLIPVGEICLDTVTTTSYIGAQHLSMQAVVLQNNNDNDNNF